MATLAEFRARHGFGRAIAAPQIGVPLRVIALDLGAGPFVVVNPETTWKSDEMFELWDDCFSVPNRLVRVLRHRSVTVSYLDDSGRRRVWQRLPADLAELLQHEIDHLDGILMLTRATGADAVRPASERALLVDSARPAHRLSLAHIAEAARTLDPVFRNSPQYLSEPLSAELGCDVTLKVETLNPVRSFKGRGADFHVSRLAWRGAVPPLVCASAGNFGQALAYVCRKHALPLVVVAAR